MRVDEELRLLIKSRNPVVFFESIDELHSLEQLTEITTDSGLGQFRWSLTDGLSKIPAEGTYYQTKDPNRMLEMVLGLVSYQGAKKFQPAIFILRDFHKYLDNALTLRLFKDVINKIRNTQTTLVILSAEYKIPKELESETAHLTGGYPTAKEIEGLIIDTIGESWQSKTEIKMSLTRDETTHVVAALQGLSIQQVRSVLNQCVISDNILNISDLKIIESCKKKIFDKEGLLEFYLTEDMNSIAGFDNLKRWLAERKDCFHPTTAAAALPAPKGVLLMGIQGCGKSLAIKAIARELGLPLYRLDLSRLYSKYIGESEENLRKALMTVQKLSPCCLWVDEIFFVDLPDARSREALFKIHFQKRNLKPDGFDIPLLAAATHDFSGAEIEQTVISALYRASGGKEPLNTGHILEQIRETKPLSILKSEEITSLRTWAKDRTRLA